MRIKARYPEVLLLCEQSSKVLENRTMEVFRVEGTEALKEKALPFIHFIYGQRHPYYLDCRRYGGKDCITKAKKMDRILQQIKKEIGWMIRYQLQCCETKPHDHHYLNDLIQSDYRKGDL